MLMVELGDLREGIMPCDLPDAVARVVAFPNIEIRGIGTNLACRNGVVPDDRNLGELRTWRHRPKRSSASRSVSCRAATRPASAGCVRREARPDRQRPSRGIDPARPRPAPRRPHPGTAPGRGDDLRRSNRVEVQAPTRLGRTRARARSRRRRMRRPPTRRRPTRSTAGTRSSRSAIRTPIHSISARQPGCGSSAPAVTTS